MADVGDQGFCRFHNVEFKTFLRPRGHPGDVSQLISSNCVKLEHNLIYMTYSDTV